MGSLGAMLRAARTVGLDTEIEIVVLERWLQEHMTPPPEEES